MTSSFFRLFFLMIIIVITLVFMISFSSLSLDSLLTHSDLDGEFVWPLPGYSYISSFFGKRDVPTAGASRYHSGIDIPAPEGTPIYAVYDGTVSFCSWGAGRRIYYCS